MFYRYILDELDKWSKSGNRKPLVLRGARQVGKTTVIETFASRFSQYIYLNLESEPDKKIFIPGDIDRLVQIIFIAKGKELKHKNDTLLFIDEIQQVPGALNMLRYFYEKYPELRVVAAGSLLETILDKETTIPVGRVDYMILRPASFAEFLGAMGNKQLLQQLEMLPANDFAHQPLLDSFHTYALIGGMPEIVSVFAGKKDITVTANIYERLINSYLEDVEKYGKKDLLVRVIRHCIRAGFREAGKRITFNRFGQSDYSSREIGEALRIMERVFLLSLVYPAISSRLPLAPDYRKSPRLHVLDTGMMNYLLGIQTDILGTDELNKIHEGVIIEHLVGQELIAGQFNPLSSLHFWTREKKTSQAEIDYIYPYEGWLIPIEVKSGKSGTLRSLHLFMDEAPHDLALRFYSDRLHLTEVTTPAGKPFLLLSLPYYLAFQTPKYIAWLKSEGRSYLEHLKTAVRK